MTSTLTQTRNSGKVAAMLNSRRMSNLTFRLSFVLPTVLTNLLQVALFVFLGQNIVRFFLLIRELFPRFARHLRDFVRLWKRIALLLAFLFELLSKICGEVNVGRGGPFHLGSVSFSLLSFPIFNSLGFLRFGLGQCCLRGPFL